MAVSNPGEIFTVNDPLGLQNQYVFSNANTARQVKTWPLQGEIIITEAMLGHDVFGVSVEALVDIWVLRFGHSWVNLEDIERDEFFKMAYVRLKSLGQLEVHYLTDRSRYVCRKPE